MPGRDFAHVQDDVNPHILRMFKGTFSLDAAKMFHTSQKQVLKHIRAENSPHNLRIGGSWPGSSLFANVSSIFLSTSSESRHGETAHSSMLIFIYTCLVYDEQRKKMARTSYVNEKGLRNLGRAFTVHQYILQYPIILKAGNVGPGQTAHAQSDMDLCCPYTA